MLFVQQAGGAAADGLPPLAGEPRELLSEPGARSRKRTKWGESPCVEWSLVTLRLGGRLNALSTRSAAGRRRTARRGHAQGGGGRRGRREATGDADGRVIA